MAGKQRKNKHFSIKGVGDYWDEVKGKVTIALTPTAVANLDAIAFELDISRSEVVERIARNIKNLPIPLDVISLS